MINVNYEPGDNHKKFLKEEITEKFMKKIQDTVNHNVQFVLKKFQDSKNNENQKIQKKKENSERTSANQKVKQRIL
jgi:hypothetical protein